MKLQLFRLWKSHSLQALRNEAVNRAMERFLTGQLGKQTMQALDRDEQSIKQTTLKAYTDMHMNS